VFPHLNDFPASCVQLADCLAVPVSRPLYLCPPPLAVVAWPGAVVGAPVPEAAVHVHRDLSPGKDDVRAPATERRQRRPLDMEAETLSVKRGAQTLLGARVPSWVSR
jgi:hypothetical protein